MDTKLLRCAVLNGRLSTTTSARFIRTSFPRRILDGASTWLSKPPAVYLDYSKNRVTQETLELLLKLADSTGLRERIDAVSPGKRSVSLKSFGPSRGALSATERDCIARFHCRRFGEDQSVSKEQRIT